ncbi:Uma2 family endonuclease [Nocardia sp. NPDC052566]|uniref:Uma2 family endonuclease n=1 Tax=Nocardia sp. NPDC052566 TaxID=3364330 RepID=UPI0037CC7A14
MTIAVVHGPLKMPDSAFAMWVRGELDEYLHVPDDSRVEIIGGEIVVSPSARYGHGRVVGDIQESLFAAKLDPAFRWRSGQNSDLSLAEIEDGYIPDLFLIDRDIDAELTAADADFIRPDQIGLAVEVTSPSNAADDRPPGLRRRRRTKWNGYAATGVPFDLLIDRDPRVCTATLFSEPDRKVGRYERHRCWKFGEPIVLPEPFGLTIPTDTWTGWRED